MKTFVLISLVVLMFTIATPRAQALFGHVTAEKVSCGHPCVGLDKHDERAVSTS